MWEITVLHALRLRGAEVKHVLCDGIYSDCDVFWGATKRRHPLACQECLSRVTRLSYDMKMPYEWLGRYLTLENYAEAHRWSAGIKQYELKTAKYGDWEIGEWVRGSVHSHLRRTELDCNSPLVRKTYRSYLYSGLVACFGLNCLLENYEPDILFLFNGRMSSTRIALELAKRKNVRVIVHERGSLFESLRLIENYPCISLKLFRNMWVDWGGIPLLKEELELISRYMDDRRFGKRLNWISFNPQPQDLYELRQRLTLSPGRIIWVMFTSSDDEVVSASDRSGPFEHQMDWVKKTARYVEQHHTIDLIIRIHPNTAGEKARGNNFLQLQEFQQLQHRLPPNVKMVMPDDRISTYSLIDIGALGLVYMSTVGLEMACKGKPVIMAAPSLISDLPFVQTVESKDEYFAMLDSALEKPLISNSLEIQRLAYRFAHIFFIKDSIPFPLVKMPTVHSGRLNYNSLDELMPGCDPNLDRICRIILKNEPICPPPGVEELTRSETDEILWFEDNDKSVDAVVTTQPEGDFYGSRVK